MVDLYRTRREKREGGGSVASGGRTPLARPPSSVRLPNRKLAERREAFSALNEGEAEAKSDSESIAKARACVSKRSAVAKRALASYCR